MARKSTDEKKARKKKLDSFAGKDGFDTSAQESEYRNLRKRVEARKDAGQILKIAERIEKESGE